ncbi:MAG: GAF domain-containing protein [Chitinophagaceae bacterium]|nr:MAG: GAF domain-containing protein [Chitinophagaceae bacterium]
MNLKTNVDAEFCGRVPLHQTNLIQPHGALLVVDKNDHSILQVSENAEKIFSINATGLVTRKFVDLISAANQDTLQALLATANGGKLPFVFQVEDAAYLSIIHQQPEFYLVEIDIQKRQNGSDQSFISVYQDVKYMMASVDATATTEETCRVVVQELKKLSGFDKVMIYRFDENWNGDVIAEAKEEEMDAYLGLKFPASDIPKQARDLYKKTPYRLVPAIDYEPVKLYPVLNPKTSAFTNLSDSNLRSVAGVHLEYLRNMKVNASMSTRILKDGELWGLIACHHRTPKYLSYEMCSVFELISNVITTKISAVQSIDSLAYNSLKQKELTELVKKVYRQDGQLAFTENLCSLLEADGISVILDNHIESVGKTPSANEVEDLVMWLSTNEVNETYHQPSLPAVYEPAEAYAGNVSGLLALPIESSKGNFILAFRSEAVQKVAWGGNPAEAVQFESDGKKYHPRASFKQWQETVKHTSVPWSKELLRTANEVKSVLTSYRLNNL